MPFFESYCTSGVYCGRSIVACVPCADDPLSSAAFYAAHREIFRVLKPNARHIFTVPYDPGAPQDDIRARLVGTKIEYRAQQLYHGDPLHPDQGILVWRIFGREMLSILEEVGFHVTAHELNDPTCGIIGEGAIVFEAVKPR